MADTNNAFISRFRLHTHATQTSKARCCFTCIVGSDLADRNICFVVDFRSIPLASFVGRFEVYHSMQGAQGQWAPAPKGQLASDLGSEDKDECIKIVLRKGGEQQGDRVTKQIGRAGEPGATLK